MMLNICTAQDPATDDFVIVNFEGDHVGKLQQINFSQKLLKRGFMLMNCRASCGKTQPLTCLHIGCNIFPFVTSFERPTFRSIH